MKLLFQIAGVIFGLWLALNIFFVLYAFSI